MTGTPTLFPTTGITPAQASILATRLERRARTLRDEISASIHSGALEIAPDTRATSDVEASVAAASVQRDGDELREIEAALARVKAGRYGICAECGAPLPLARLGALPYARNCMACETARQKTRPPTL